MKTGLTYLSYLQQHHFESYAHCVRVGIISVFLRAKYNLSIDFSYAAYLHDIGKLYVPTSILSKPGRLTDSEIGILHMHPTWGYSLLADTDCSLYARKLILYHHENIDSKGYPYPLPDFSLESNLLSVIDSYDAINAKRAYSCASSKEEALVRLSSGIETQFSREAYEMFTDFLPELKADTLDASKLNLERSNAEETAGALLRELKGCKDRSIRRNLSSN